ncbi:unnamed protein product [Paramecium sonneborni]|uniref:Uncharacterized protein n=1 Tax=Paramecium sonneborni TaxID=65129 RepID=A0A8S1QZN9_9CILI|nr:unnamed protein product [Paramecium sonneborni]
MYLIDSRIFLNFHKGRQGQQVKQENRQQLHQKVQHLLQQVFKLKTM